MFQSLNTLYTILSITIVFWFTPLFALSKDNEKPMQIFANSSQFNYKTGEDVYEGDVKINQGSTRLKADRLTTKKNSQHRIEEATAYGLNKLAEYVTLPKEGDGPFQAQANIIRFYPLKSTVILEGNVKVTQGENSFQGQMIIYNIKDQIVTAPPRKNGRATIIIEPKQIKS